MAKVVVRIRGGLGNQLFCYAAARRLAMMTDAELVIDDVTGFVRDRLYNREYALDKFTIPVRKATRSERMEPFERYRRGIAKFIARQLPFHKRKYVEQEGSEFVPRLLEFRPCGTVYLDGLWQSEGYFKDIEEVIRQDLQILSPQDAANQKMAATIASCNSIGVHVRWFDKPRARATETNHNLKDNYYVIGIKEIMNKVASPHFFLFSDDPNEAKNLLDIPEGMEVTCVSHNIGDENAYADLWLMTQCKHFIIANSTFSWWGAWLAKASSKIVIAPDIKISGITAWGFSGLIPADWKKI